MFERYSEKARRVIFFARYEASQYGSRQIETEHVLLGLMREGKVLMTQLLGPDLDLMHIRTEIEKVITKGKTFSTAVEVPLSGESKNVLQFAVEEAERLGKRHIEIEHLLLGLLRVDESLAARILKENGCLLVPIRQKLATLSSSISAEVKSRPKEDPVAEIHKFLARLRSNNPGELALLFAKNGQVVDFKGMRWRGRDEIEKESQRLFVPYTLKNVTSVLESVDDGPGGTYVASVLWENVVGSVEPPKSMHRMTVVLAKESGAWVVLFIQVTPVIGP
jgi:uncharacterized protein (TIGR02246 family)